MANAFFRALGNMFRTPATVRYPFEQTYKPNDYRGLIEYNESLCIFCRKCEISCPAGAIIFSQCTETGKQTYHYSPTACVYCGECVRACPKPGAIVQSATPGKPVTSAEDPNNRWNATVKSALEGRKVWQEKQKAKALAAAAAKAAAAKEEPKPE